MTMPWGKSVNEETVSCRVARLPTVPAQLSGIRAINAAVTRLVAPPADSIKLPCRIGGEGGWQWQVLLLTI
jgi:hypothetical protein